MWRKSDNDPERSSSTSPSSSPSPAQPTRQRPRGAGGERAIIGPSISIHGDVTGEEDLVVQGRIEGKIDLKQQNVTIGEEGRVKADIYGRLILVEGEVRGNLFGDEKIVVATSGLVVGNITAPRVTLEDGCRFKGSIDMEPKRETKPKPSSPSTSGSSGSSRSPSTSSTSSSSSAPSGGSSGSSKDTSASGETKGSKSG